MTFSIHLLLSYYMLSKFLVCSCKHSNFNRVITSSYKVSSRIRLLSTTSRVNDNINHNTKSILDNLILVKGIVTTGYGRGSKKLGFPTANLPYFDQQLSHYNISNGVYYGWTTIAGDVKIYPCVANIGKSPTFVGQENSVRIIETHIISPEELPDFYQKDMNLCLVGYIRPEMKFASFQDLIQQITDDVNYTKEITTNIAIALEPYKQLKIEECIDLESKDSEAKLSLLSNIYQNFISKYLLAITSIIPTNTSTITQQIQQIPVLSTILLKNPGERSEEGVTSPYYSTMMIVTEKPLTFLTTISIHQIILPSIDTTIISETNGDNDMIQEQKYKKDPKKSRKSIHNMLISDIVSETKEYIQDKQEQTSKKSNNQLIDPKKYKKGNLPTKICEQCNRPMEWRKSWAKNWDEVKYCSDKCRKMKKSSPI